MVFKKEIIVFILGIVVGALGLLIFYPQKKCEGVVFTKAEECENVKGASTDIVVDVSGAVANPGVYKLPKGSRVSDAIKSAGDVLSARVNKEYLSKSINLAQLLQDGTKLYIPFEGELVPVSSATVGTSVSKYTNINTASESELADNLFGIGPTYAKNIIGGRPYSKIEELYEKNIIPKATFEKIKGDISVN